ncbi:MAG: SUMF1/EgtB/PvdO family nonheme iron enzyme, partial [Planctomycetaceae bacterium]|nr:SUMF1/EgtB/PvdO family nonheme iron enzyme [Planctomycetaceae bacterium]
MPDHEDSLGGETLAGDVKADPAEQSLGDGSTLGGGEASSLSDTTDGEGENLAAGLPVIDLGKRFEIEGELGQGGMGAVLLARDKSLGRQVAIKRILGTMIRSSAAVNRFITEAKSIAALNHHNIVQIYEFGQDDDGPLIVIEYVSGGSLLDRLKQGKLEPGEAIRITCQLCDALTFAHGKGIIHRDIKPANVLLTEDGVPKLTDFGLAKQQNIDHGQTAVGAIMGTIDFMPPEQRRDSSSVDERSDLWSLAAVCYQMLTGKSPKVIRERDMPVNMRDSLMQALEEDPADRFQTAHEMREAILFAYSGKIDTSHTLGEGECPQCATTNPSENKHCDECGTSLKVKCLSCKSDISIWNKACRECGAQQAPLVEEALVALKATHDQAESLLEDLRYKAATDKAASMTKETDSRLQQYASWHEDFSTRLELSRTSELARLAEQLQEALSHEQAYDYEAGLQTLAQVAPALKQTTIDGGEDAAEELIVRLTSKQTRLKELEGIVRERVAKKEDTGLLPIVKELLALSPDRPEFIELQSRLVAKEESIATRNQDAISVATQCMASARFDEAISGLNSIYDLDRTDEVRTLIEQAKSFLQQREAAAQALEEAEKLVHFVTATRQAAVYLKRIAKADIQDPQLQQMLDEAKGKEAASFRKKSLVMVGIVAAFIIVVTITGVVMKMNNSAKALETAIADGNWETVLELDPDNAEGLRLQDAAEKVAAEKAAAEKAAILAGDPITNTVSMTFNNIPAGTFLMGSPETEPGREDDETQHMVTITKSFYMQTTEVTQGQWKALMGTEPWKGEDYVKKGADYPATYVSWDDAVAYCEKLSEKESVTYRLPTEAEWEYACRAETKTTWSFGNDEKALDDYAWYDKNTFDVGERYAHQVGLKKPNAFGLYDMHGNVFEWCHDYVEENDISFVEQDPQGPTQGSSRVL